MFIKIIWRLLITQIYWRCRFGKLGYRSVVFKPLLVSKPSKIWIGSRTQIRDFARLEVVSRPKLGWDAKLEIGSGVLIEQGVHIVCQGSIVIEDNVAIAAYCTIVDTYHPHENPDDPVPIGSRLPDRFSSVHIGEGTFIGVHCSILPNIKIGKKCVIGAGSVINRDIPDYSMVSGSPARIISRYSQNIGKWV